WVATTNEGGAGARVEVMGQPVVVAQQGGPHLQDRFRALIASPRLAAADRQTRSPRRPWFLRAVPEFFGPLHPPAELLDQRLDERTGDRYPRAAIFRISHPLEIVRQVGERFVHDLPRIGGREILQANVFGQGMFFEPRPQLRDHLARPSLPTGGGVFEIP